MIPREGTPFPAGLRRWFPAVLAAAAVAAVGVLTGCSEDILGKNTAIKGQVLEAGDESPIFGVNIGVVYDPVQPTAAPGSGLRAAGSAASDLRPAATGLGEPYPNPGVGPLSIPVAVDAPTALQVEIRTTVSGVSGNIAVIFIGTVAQDTTLTWDGRDNFNEDVPNGLYTVRFTAPPGTSPVDKPVVVNRSASQISAQGIYNVVSGPEGDYLLTDLAVGEDYTATGTGGQVLGTGSLRNRVTLVFRDPDYVPSDVVVIIGQGDTVDPLLTYLTRLLAAGPLP
jgi:hypothetical protein